MKKDKNPKAKKSEGSEKHDKEVKESNGLTYFLDHPDIERGECIGNARTVLSASQVTPPSQVRGGTFGGVGAGKGSTASTGGTSIASKTGFNK